MISLLSLRERRLAPLCLVTRRISQNLITNFSFLKKIDRGEGQVAESDEGIEIVTGRGFRGV